MQSESRVSQEQPEDQRPDKAGRPNLGRRAFLAAVTVGANLDLEDSAEAAAPHKAAQRGHPTTKPKAPGHVTTPERHTPEIVTGKKYYTGLLAGRTLNDLYVDYMGIEGKIPPEAIIDFQKQLTAMWQKKFKRAGRNETSGHNKVVEEVGNKILKDYKDKPPITLTVKNYETVVQQKLTEVIAAMDWQKLGSLERLSPEKLALVEGICQSVTAKHLLAYSLTELMPSADGQLNVEVLNFLLESAGREYIEAIPAMFDPKTSFGPYQFTEYALYDDGKERRGASIPNQALKRGKIEGSVAKLKGLDHHEAAYLFMVHNFSTLIQHLTPKEQSVLAANWKTKTNDLVGYAATAHHGPAIALNIGRRWLDNGAKLPFVVSCGRVYGKYAAKTDANFNALQKIV